MRLPRLLFLAVLFTLVLYSNGLCYTASESSYRKTEFLHKEDFLAQKSLKYGQIIYVEQSTRCKKGMILKVTGGKKGNKIKRKYECLRRLSSAEIQPFLRYTIPPKAALKQGEVVYVEKSKRCNNGLLLKITGGKKNVRRRYQCVPRPKEEENR